MRRKLVVNDPTLPHPTAKQISATDLSLTRRRDEARSRRRVRRYWWGDSPNVDLNWRLKWAGDIPAAAARSATLSESK